MLGGIGVPKRAGVLIPLCSGLGRLVLSMSTSSSERWVLTTSSSERWVLFTTDTLVCAWVSVRTEYVLGWRADLRVV